VKDDAASDCCGGGRGELLAWLNLIFLLPPHVFSVVLCFTIITIYTYILEWTAALRDMMNGC
jgi:hypothetical protein